MTGRFDGGEAGDTALRADNSARAESVLRLPFGLIAAVAMILAAGLATALRLPGFIGPMAAEMVRSGIAAVPLGALLPALAALIGTRQIVRARLRGEAAAVGRAARVPQAVIIPILSLAGMAVAWRAHAGSPPALAPAALCYALGAAAGALAFPLLLAERQLASIPRHVLPEATALRALALAATAICFTAGLLEIGAGLGLPYTNQVIAVPAWAALAIGAELTARALGRLFLPPPPADSARAVCTSLLAGSLGAAAAEGGFTAPIREHFGIDFSRSWALAYARSAAVPMLLLLLLLGWGLTGVVLIPLDARGVYERYGAPVRVLHPGLHLILPWPMGTARRVEFGAVHDLALGADAAAPAPAGAEDLPPPEADRLWETPHKGEITLAVASGSGARQSFQSVSADLRILYCTGLTDAQALAATYSTADPQALVRAVAGRVVAAYSADRTLEQMLGASREAMAETLRSRVQAELDQAGSGLQVVAVVIEAIHPPAEAADAYHYVRAAEIAARTSIASERGNAIVIRSQSRQYATSQIDAARATAAETISTARVALTRFTADREAAKAGGHVFLLERYFTDLSAALAKSPKVIIDHRLNWPEAPVLDLRPPSGVLPTDSKAE
jgi:regulator of protease activity HflC (stomatin/prohibitin superfamily)